MSQLKHAILPLICITVLACHSVGLSHSVAVCASVAGEYSGVIVGSFDTTVDAIRRQGPPEPARWPQLAPDHPAVLCYIDATIAKAPPPGPSGEFRRSFDRAVFGVVDGRSEMIVAGFRDQLPVTEP